MCIRDSSTGVFTWTPTAEGWYYAVVNATDPDGLYAESWVTIYVARGANQPPVADAGPDQDVQATGETAEVYLDGSGSSDPDGDSLTYSWKLNGVEFSTDEYPTATLPLGEHVITLTVTDVPYGASDTDDVLITVYQKPNQAPVANAGTDQDVQATGETAEVYLDGSGSSDPDYDLLTYSWTLDGAVIATGEYPVVALPVGVHVITLTVTDPDGLSASDTVTVTVTVAPPPPTTPVVSSAKVSVKGKNVQARVMILNPTTTTARDVTVTAATLQGVATNTKLPAMVVKSLKPGKTASVTLNFDGIAVPEGKGTLDITGTSSLGGFSGSLEVIVP